MPRSFLFSACVLLALGACGGESPVAPVTPSSPSPSPIPAATARYRVTFDAAWSEQTHPTDIPATPHFSGLIGGTHRSTVTLWEEGGIASEGIRLMAERGRQTPLDTEVGAAIAAGHAQHVLAGDDVPRSPGSVTFEFYVTRDYALVTLVSMIAPSPDWFVGVSSLSLIEGGSWVAEKVVTLHAYDAGTDSGVTFSSADVQTRPPQPIHRITTGPLVVGGSVPPLGTFTFRRIS
jgi:spondin N